MKGQHYVVVQHAGTDKEQIIFDAASAGQAHDYVSYHTPEERDELGIDVMRQRPDGTLTTEL